MLNNKLALGTVQFGMDYGISNFNGMTTQSEFEHILDFCASKNLYTLDTAKSYGESENRIGQYIKKNKDKPWDIITKIKGDVPAKKQIENSIKKLNSIPSAVLAHDVKDYLNPSFRKDLFFLKHEYSIKKVGVSVYDSNDILKILDYDHPDLIQLPLNVLDTRILKSGIINELYSKNIEIHVRSVFLQGLFYLPMKMIKSKFSDVYKTLKKLNEISKKNDLKISELSLLFVSSLSQISKVVVGVNSLDQLQTHFLTMAKKLDEKLIDEVIDINYDNENILNPRLWK